MEKKGKERVGDDERGEEMCGGSGSALLLLCNGVVLLSGDFW